YVDYRQLLESDAFDAVSIATPNHTHAIIAIAALQAGKHVYVEKPTSHNIWESRQLVAAARKYGKIVQVGTQCRSSRSLRDALNWLHSGHLGDIQYAIGTCYKRRASIGISETPLEFPSHIDRDLWVGPAADQAIYRPAKNSQGKENPHYDWHWDFNTGGGDLGNQGIHQMDVARWFLGESDLAPRVLSIGGRVGYKDAGDTANTQLVLHAYEKAPLLFEVRGLPKAAGQREMDSLRGSAIGVIIQCERGHLLIPSYTEAIAYDADGAEINRWRGGGKHHDNWLQAIAAGDSGRLHAGIREGHVSSALCHAGNASYRVGRLAATAAIAEAVSDNELLADAFDRMCQHLRANEVDVDGEPLLTMGEWLQIDPQTEQFVGNDAAAELWARKGRAPFVVPDIERELAGQSAAVGG
ncbi:MAG TPA: Gfo/Idh/MocA family oxidoreductase, partial [Lacipirellulaceae bacterium]|nr:Gfo/Idh/MocA family oxidoreductase [Lacipirellulaceae bacterium]